MDPTYVTDFWSGPGYLGTDPDSSVGTARATADTAVVQVIHGFPMRIESTAVPDWDIANAHLVLTSGAAAGKSVPIAGVDGRTVEFLDLHPVRRAGAIQPGDRATIDNSWPVALQTYQRHQVPTPDLDGWDQFRDTAGEPRYPQRARLVGPVAAADTAGSVLDGRITAKTLVLESLVDIDALAWQVDWYRTTVRKALGEHFADEFAVWFIDHAQHDDPQTPPPTPAPSASAARCSRDCAT